MEMRSSIAILLNIMLVVAAVPACPAEVEETFVARSGKTSDQGLVFHAPARRTGLCQGAARNCASDYYQRGIYAEEFGDYDVAAIEYGEAIKIDPGYREAYLRRGVAYEIYGHFDRAIADFSKAIVLDPSFGRAYHLLGILRKSMGDNAKGDRDMEKAKQLDATGGD